MSTTTDPSSKPATVEATAPSASPATSPPAPVAPSIAVPSAPSSVTPVAAAPPVPTPAPVVVEGKPPVVSNATAVPPATAAVGGAVAKPPPAQPAKSTGATTKSSGSSGKGSKRSKSKKQSPSVTMATAPTASQSGSTGGENTGRWTAEEHRLFLQGLDQHGKGWKKIASLIKSRTVVQIRTHAQKYFQKLAKARQNGEEGDVTMEGRGGGAIIGGGGVCGGGSSGHPGKKKRQLTGTKRKHISSVVSSVTTKEVKIVTVDNQAAPSVAGEVQAQAQADPVVIPKGVPSVAPALAPFIVSPSNSVDQASLTPAVLEDSLYRFLTPVTGDTVFTDTVASNAADSAAVPTPAPVSGQTTIKVPIETSAPGQAVTTGETSPTGVADIAFPTFDPKEPPQWYSKGGDVDELLDEADTLDWLADSGDLEESYNLSSTKQGNSNPAPTTSEMASLCSTSDSSSEGDPTPTVVSVRSSSQDLVCKPSVSSASITTDNGMMTLPALFEQPSQPSQPPLNKKPKLAPSANVVYSSATEAVEATLPSVSSAANINDELAVFDTAFDEQAFVSALLDGSSSSNLPAATMS